MREREIKRWNKLSDDKNDFLFFVLVFFDVSFAKNNNETFLLFRLRTFTKIQGYLWLSKLKILGKLEKYQTRNEVEKIMGQLTRHKIESENVKK